MKKYMVYERIPGGGGEHRISPHFRTINEARLFIVQRESQRPEIHPKRMELCIGVVLANGLIHPLDEDEEED